MIDELQPSLFGPELSAAEPVVVPGLLIVPNWIDHNEHDELIVALETGPWETSLSRRVQHYGWKYNYGARNIDPDNNLGPLPDWLALFSRRLEASGFFDRPAEQVIINEYLPTQGIAGHTDRNCFGPTVATLSLLDAWPMQLELPGQRKLETWLPPRSLTVLAGDVRRLWRHGIAKRKTDIAPTGLRRARQRRISVTFRTINIRGRGPRGTSSRASVEETEV